MSQIPTENLGGLWDRDAEPDCAEFREDGSCIHSDHMEQAEAAAYRNNR